MKTELKLMHDKTPLLIYTLKRLLDERAGERAARLLSRSSFQDPDKKCMILTYLKLNTVEVKAYRASLHPSRPAGFSEFLKMSWGLTTWQLVCEMLAVLNFGSLRRHPTLQKQFKRNN